ncbi:ABC transporter substrate-binding protein [Pelagibacterium xiamenense]|uniref:ABC transporter substrate-binding protein n=1 Tax=Pelagibacterium xiamenense TaxID=2901140 RepID=UPI001E513023|nr:ABC transporter substrate-binding protein [Pelagibacterium xiamenense]MCD7058682.1 ABC transporter substrate-binding protein [Pelagibacterium xiamenense]
MIHTMTYRTKLATVAVFASFAVTAGVAQDTLTLTDGTGTEVAVPAEPERIVSLHDTSLTVALIELGVIPVGSHGRTEEDGTPFIRSAELVTGYDFANSGIAFVGNLPADVEAVAALEPDLILTTSWQTAGVDQLRAIAPTYVFDIDATDDFDVYARIAEVTGTTDRLEKLENRYRAQLEVINGLVDTSGITVSVIQGYNGELQVWNTYGSLGKVLRDAGFTFPDAINAIEGNSRQIFSGEAYPEFDGDFIFVTYRPSRGETPADARAALDEVLPGWCDVLHACANNQVIYIPREIASSATYDSLFALTEIVGSQIVGRDFVPMPE